MIEEVHELEYQQKLQFDLLALGPNYMETNIGGDFVHHTWQAKSDLKKKRAL